SDITSKESTLQVVYVVLRLTPFFKAFLVTTDVPEIYMQEFWATATVHHHSIRFKMNNKKRIVNLDYFREMLHIYPRIPNQTFDELPFEEEILAFLRYLGHGGEIKKITDGMYHKKNMDFAYLLREDFVYQVEHKDAKKSNEMYYPKFIKVIINFFMTKDPLIPRRNKFGAMLPVELTNEDIRKYAAYKEYYAIALGASPPKTKASVRKTQSSFNTTMPPPTAVGHDVQMTDVHITQVLKDTHVTLTPVNPDGQQQSSSVSSQFVTSMFNLSPDAVTAPTLPPPTIPIMQQFDEVVSSIPGIVDRYIDHQMNEAVKVAEQVKVQVSKILPTIEKTVNEQLEAEVLTRSSNSSKTSYAVAAGLSELELKKILIKKMESNKSIHRSDEQRNLYKALVDAYEYKEPSARSDWGSKRRREGKEPESTSAPKEKASKTIVLFINRLSVDTLTPELLAGLTYELMKGSYKSLVELEFFLKEVYKVTTDQLDWNNPKGQQYPHNLLKPLPLIPYSRDRGVIPFDHFINNDLEYLRGGAFSHKYTTSVTKTKATDYGHIKWIEDLFYRFAINRESAKDVYSKHRIIAVTELQIGEWHNYKHLDWINVHRDDDKLYKFREGNFKRLRIQDIEDMLLLLVQGKLTNLTVEERFAFNKLNLIKPDTYRSDLKHKEAYIAYSNPRGFIYQNKDKRSSLMRIDELHKFIDDTLNDVRTALDDRLKGIRIKYLPQTIWQRSDKERAAAMI
nr:hypothetical protein [Tanacetum cinerariifolium]